MKKIQILYADPFIREDVVYKLLCEKYKLEAISIPKVIKEEIRLATSLGLEISSHFNKGELLPSELVNTLIHQQVTSTDKDILLRNFPMTPDLFHAFVKQLEDLDAGLDRIWHFELVNPEHGIKMFQSQFNPENKYEVAPGYILEKVNSRRDNLRKLINLWKLNFDIQIVKVDFEKEEEISAYFEKVLAELD